MLLGCMVTQKLLNEKELINLRPTTLGEPASLGRSQAWVPFSAAQPIAQARRLCWDTLLPQTLSPCPRVLGGLGHGVPRPCPPPCHYPRGRNKGTPGDLPEASPALLLPLPGAATKYRFIQARKTIKRSN